MSQKTSRITLLKKKSAFINTLEISTSMRQNYCSYIKYRNGRETQKNNLNALFYILLKYFTEIIDSL